MALAWRGPGATGWARRPGRARLRRRDADPGARDRGGPRGRAPDARGGRPRRRDARRRARSRSTTSARPPTTAASCRRGSCIACCARPAAGDRRRVTIAADLGRLDGRARGPIRRRRGAAVRGCAGLPVPARGCPPVRIARALFERAREIAHAMPEPRAGRAGRRASAARRAAGVGLGAVLSGAGLRPSRPRRISPPRRHGSETASRRELDRLNREYEAHGSASATVSSWPADRAPSCCPSIGGRARSGARFGAPSGARRGRRHRHEPATGASPRTPMSLRARRQPLRQVADPACHRPARPGAAPPPRPDRRRRARGRLRRRPRRGRQRRTSSRPTR